MLKGRERCRWRIYTIGSAVLILLGGYGMIADEKVSLWVGLLGAVTNCIAAANTPSDKDPNDDNKTPSQN